MSTQRNLFRIPLFYPHLSPPTEYSSYAVAKSNSSAAASNFCISRSSWECSTTSETMAEDPEKSGGSIANGRRSFVEYVSFRGCTTRYSPRAESASQMEQIGPSVSNNTTKGGLASKKALTWSVPCHVGEWLSGNYRCQGQTLADEPTWTHRRHDGARRCGCSGGLLLL